MFYHVKTRLKHYFLRKFDLISGFCSGICSKTTECCKFFDIKNIKTGFMYLEIWFIVIKSTKSVSFDLKRPDNCNEVFTTFYEKESISTPLGSLILSIIWLIYWHYGKPHQNIQFVSLAINIKPLYICHFMLEKLLILD